MSHFTICMNYVHVCMNYIHVCMNYVHVCMNYVQNYEIKARTFAIFTTVVVHTVAMSLAAKSAIFTLSITAFILNCLKQMEVKQSNRG